jgi:hypothetical protein
MKFTRSEIEAKIVEKVEKEGKTIEGVFYECNFCGGGWQYTIDTYSLALLMADVKNGNMWNVYYFKCTKKKGLEWHRVF